MSHIFYQKDNLVINWNFIVAKRVPSKMESPQYEPAKEFEVEYRLELIFNIVVNWKLKSFNFFLDLNESWYPNKPRWLYIALESEHAINNIAYVLQSLWYDIELKDDYFGSFWILINKKIAEFIRYDENDNITV